MFGYDPAKDMNRFNREVHYRLYLSPRDNKPGVIPMQDFDYAGYDNARFIGPWAFDDESDAEQFLQTLMLDAAKLLNVLPDFLRLDR